LYLYKFKNDQWALEKKISGFDISAQYFEFADAKTILVNHEYKGIIKLNLSDDFTHVEDYEILQSVEKGLFSSILKYNDHIFYTYKDGVFKYDKENSVFKRDSVLSAIITPQNYCTGMMVKTEDNKLWFFNTTDIISVSNSSLKDQYVIQSIPISSSVRQQISGYENISYNGKDAYILGKSDGFLKINSAYRFDEKFKVYVTDILIKNKDNLSLSDFDLSGLDNEFNNIRFQLSSFNYDPLLKSEYQYRLDGYNDEWSPWQESSVLNFKNLPYGDYSLSIRSRVGETNRSEVSIIDFTILKPFYLSAPMIIFYVFIILILGVCIHLVYRWYYKKQKLSLKAEAEKKLRLQELEAQKEIMDINNNRLKLDIENKNRELAISTMSLIKKNEFLSNLKSNLKPLKNSNSVIREVIKSINMNIDSQDDWKFFEEAFNNADKDFFKRLKELHPALTHNDFKLCAYLRLNLSSKEIAPLFNISTKSVEIKRYRLRKKMDLDREQSLTDYILSI
jgi:DNA-binding CsgD family transcriptional regulator